MCIAGNSSSRDLYIYTDEEHILYGNKEYSVAGTLDSNSAFFFFFFLSSEPENTKVKYIYFQLKTFPDKEQTEEIENLFYR